MSFNEKLGEIAEGLRRLKRGLQGLPLDDDIYSGLLNVKDIRERTRVPNWRAVRGRAYMRMLGAAGGEEWAMMTAQAEQIDVYSISFEGEQRKEAILMQRAKATSEINVQAPTMALPQVETNRPLAEPQQQQKKGLFRK